MATVQFSAAQQSLTGGARSVQIDAATVKDLLADLERRFPGLAAHLQHTSSTAVAVDGDIISEPLHERLSADAEVHLIRPLAGG